MEQATARPIELARHDAGDRRQALGGSPLRQGGQQGGRVGVVWIREEACDRLLFHLLPGILHHDALGGLRHHAHVVGDQHERRSEEHTSELQSLMRISYAVFCLKKKKILTTKRQATDNYNNNTYYKRPIKRT